MEVGKRAGGAVNRGMEKPWRGGQRSGQRHLPTKTQNPGLREMGKKHRRLDHSDKPGNTLHAHSRSRLNKECATAVKKDRKSMF